MATTPTPAPGATSGDDADTLPLARWTVTSGSNSNSRGAVVIAAGDHQWEASAEGNGAVDALFRAVDKALAEVLTGHPAPARLRRPRGRRGPRCRGPGDGRRSPRRPRPAAPAASGRYVGEVTSTNIIAASIEAYVDAINELLAEEHWSGATESAGNRKRAKVSEPDAQVAPGGARRGSRPDRHDRLVQSMSTGVAELAVSHR